jgi:Holliday junction resolvase RusA-like endonuclease
MIQSVDDWMRETRAARDRFVIARVEIRGYRPAPWCVTTRYRSRDPARARAKDRLKAWQQRLRIAAREVYRGAPIQSAVAVDATFFLVRRGQIPDRTNLLKAAEDALQRIVYVNDRQICDGRVRRQWVATRAEEGCLLTVRAADSDASADARPSTFMPSDRPR